jgi:hypothetical protein
MSKKYFFTAISRLTMEPDGARSKVESIELRLELSNNLDNKMYLNKGVPTKDGTKALTVALIAGLTANIHTAHKNGWWKDHEHMEYIIKHLNEGFVTSPDKIGEGDMNENPLDPRYEGSK